MISVNSWLFTIIFLVLVIGFTDFFVKIPYENRCEMTYMYQVPQYVPITLSSSLNKEFPNYNLYVYGEGDYAESLRLNEFTGSPVLFIPGNGGSFKQVRSLASVSLVMSYGSTTGATHHGFNYFTLDFNEELSAFIGGKLDSQTQYLFHAIKKILQLYSEAPKTKIVLIGHSIGGILIKALFTKPYFKSYLGHVAVVFTLATPHQSPAIPFDLKILSFYEQCNEQFIEERPSHYGHINVVSIGGSSNDKLIRPDTILLGSNYQFDRSILTTAIDDVWASADHLCIVWCRQLTVKLNQILFDLIDNNMNLLEFPERRQEIIDFHLAKRHAKGHFPNYKILNQVIYSNKSEWIEHNERLIRLNITKLISPVNHLIPLRDRETIVLHLVGQFKYNTLSTCTATLLQEKLSCSGEGVNLYEHVRLVPGLSQDDRHIAHLQSITFLNLGYTHLVLSLTPSPSSYSILIDRFTTQIRQHTIKLPYLWDFLFAGNGLFKPMVVFTKLISQEHSFFNLTLDNFDFVWKAYFIQVQTRSCYNRLSSFVGYGYLSLEQSELNEFHWPFRPLKGSNMQFTLKLNSEHSAYGRKPSLLMHFEPNCGFEILARFSIIDFSSQLVKHYFTLLVPIIISTAILVISVQLSNMMLLYSYSNEAWDKFKSQYHVDLCEGNLANKKCIIYLKASQVMKTRRYFFYCYAQIIFYSIISLYTLKSFFPRHDLAHLAAHPLYHLVLVCSILFLFAYSLIFCFTTLIHFLANHIASGVNYVLARAKFLPTANWSLMKFFTRFRWGFVFTCLTVSSLITAYIFIIQSVFYLVHLFFTILMLVRFIKVNQLEMRIGRTTSTTFIGAFYPVIYALQLVMAVLQIPQSIDSFKTLVAIRQLSKSTLSQLWYPILTKPASTIQAFLCIVLYLLAHFHSLNLGTRLISMHTSRSHKWMNISLVGLAFGTIILGTLAFEFINYSILGTLAVILRANSALRKLANARNEVKVD